MRLSGKGKNRIQHWLTILLDWSQHSLCHPARGRLLTTSNHN